MNRAQMGQVVATPEEMPCGAYQQVNTQEDGERPACQGGGQREAREGARGMAAGFLQATKKAAAAAFFGRSRLLSGNPTQTLNGTVLLTEAFDGRRCRRSFCLAGVERVAQGTHFHVVLGLAHVVERVVKVAPQEQVTCTSV